MAVPVTLADARRQLRMTPDDTSQDTELSGFIADAAAFVEDYTGLILAARELTVALPAFDAILPGWPIANASTATVQYGLAGATPTIITDVSVSAARRPARLALPAALNRWPALAAGEAVTVTYTAGYADGAAVPGVVRAAMLILIGAYDADREGGDVVAKAEETARRRCRGLRRWSV